VAAEIAPEAPARSRNRRKELLLWPDRTRTRKASELVYVTWIEAFWPKRRIMEAYLNSVEFGPGASTAQRLQHDTTSTFLPKPEPQASGHAGDRPAEPAGPQPRRAQRHLANRIVEDCMANLGGLLDCLRSA